MSIPAVPAKEQWEPILDAGSDPYFEAMGKFAFDHAPHGLGVQRRFNSVVIVEYKVVDGVGNKYRLCLKLVENVVAPHSKKYERLYVAIVLQKDDQSRELVSFNLVDLWPDA